MSSEQADEELSLPKATVLKMVSEVLGADVAATKEARDLLIECSIDFIHLVTTEANDACERGGRKTISPEHVLEALRNLEFDDFVDQVKGSWGEHKEVQTERQSRTARLKKSGAPTEEQVAAQEEMFAQARARMLQNQSTSQSSAAAAAAPPS
ncbi:transcription corepressor [Blastocladiella britannica]|nr:transcription corepressor [Blastocladiella britannica]